MTTDPQPLDRMDLREKIARIVDPELDAHLENQTWAKCRALVNMAYGTADAILALLPDPPADREGGRPKLYKATAYMNGRRVRLVVSDEGDPYSTTNRSKAEAVAREVCALSPAYTSPLVEEDHQ
jgi:hypothetical protein